MSEQTKDVLHSEHLKYMGKILKTDGERSGPGGKIIFWKLWKLNFDSNGGKYDWSCSIFGSYDSESKPLPVKGIHIANMQEGNYYEVVYKNTEYEHQEHGTVKSKQAVLIKDSTVEKSTASNIGQKVSQTASDAPKEVSNVPQKAVAEDWVSFVKEYKEAVGDKAEAVHLFGLYVLNKHEKQFSDIITLCQKEFAEKEPMKVDM